MLNADNENSAFLENGIEAFGARNWERAIDQFGKLRTHSRFAKQKVTALLYLARAYRATGRNFDSRLVLREASALAPRKSVVIKLNAESAFERGDYAEAAEFWQKLLTKLGASAYPKIYAGLAASLRKTSQLDAAWVVARTGLERFPGNHEISREERLIDTIRAEPEIHDASELDPKRKLRNPYQGLPRRSFWMKTASVTGTAVSDWYQKKFSITGLSVATAGSCFAQHIGRRLRTGGFDFTDVEPAPAFLHSDSHVDFGYGIYSARYGNIYTSRQLLQLLQRALGIFNPQDQYWPLREGVVDPFRPTLEPQPFYDLSELKLSRENHLRSVIDLFKKTDVFTFTFGLTEAWVSAHDGAAFPIAPGVCGGVFNPDNYILNNLSYDDVLSDMRTFIDLARKIRPNLKLLLTVSPVPLMATATGQNVIVASSYSKSVLRSVAGKLASEDPFIDYFPSFEIISSHVMKGQFFEKDGRSVSPAGVDHVMRQFFEQHRPWKTLPNASNPIRDSDEVACDEELLRAFG